MQIGSKTDVGKKRKMNQDSIYVSNRPVGPLNNLFIVADGMGGHKSGDVASKFTIDSIKNYLNNYNDEDSQIESILYSVIQKVDRDLSIKANSNPDYNGMGTTMVLATIKNDELYIANIGDSRLYIYMDKLRQITEDHTRVMELVKNGEITMMEALNHSDRHQITRAIGYGGNPDFYNIKIIEGDMILICSDGLTSMIEDEKIEDIITNYDGSIQEKADKLVQIANNNGGIDNISVILVKVDKGDL